MNDTENYPNKENEKLIPTVGVVAVRDNSILLVCHDAGGGHVTGTYGLPGGRVNDHETEQEAAAREFKEETGLIAETEDFYEFEENHIIADVPRKDGTKVRMGWRIFKIQNFLGELKASSETTPVWLALRQVEDLESKNKLAPNVLNAIKAALK